MASSKLDSGHEIHARILVVGTTGSGKTTLARAISKISGLDHIELDLLRYSVGWEEVPAEEFIDQVAAVVAGNFWLIDGNYAAVRDMIWDRADLIVWLDYSLITILGRLVRRTTIRLVTSADVGNENREQLIRVLGRRSVILWAMRSHAALRKEYEMAIAARKSGSPCVLRHRSPRKTRVWLSAVEKAPLSFKSGEGSDSGGISW